MIIMITNNQVPVGILQASQGKTQAAQHHNWEGDFYGKNTFSVILIAWNKR